MRGRDTTDYVTVHEWRLECKNGVNFCIKTKNEKKKLKI